MNIKEAMYRVFQIGEMLVMDELDEDHLIDIGNELIELSGICPRCRGHREEGDDPDAAGIGGGIYPCTLCRGTGRLRYYTFETKI